MAFRNKVLQIAAALALIAGALGNAAASTWWIFASGAGGSNAYDKETLNKARHHVFVWRRDLFSAPVIMGGERYDEMQSRFDIDCSVGTEHRLAQRSYIDGHLLSGSANPGAIVPIEPDSINQWLERELCK